MIETLCDVFGKDVVCSYIFIFKTRYGLSVSVSDIDSLLSFKPICERM